MFKKVRSFKAQGYNGKFIHNLFLITVRQRKKRKYTFGRGITCVANCKIVRSKKLISNLCFSHHGFSFQQEAKIVFKYLFKIYNIIILPLHCNKRLILPKLIYIFNSNISVCYIPKFLKLFHNNCLLRSSTINVEIISSPHYLEEYVIIYLVIY